ncbi:MAG: hypothetical protein ACI87O_001160 [Planctomycetota bacterium]|jgi:hypothetical protein
MGILFKTAKEREREARKARRKAFRQAEGALADVKDRVRRIEREAKSEWDKGREAMQAGRKAEAQRAVTGYRAAQVLMTKLEQKRWVFEQYLLKMETAQTDQDFAQALNGVNQVVQINPDMVSDVFEASQEILGEQQDAERFWASLYDREMDGAAGSLEDHVPSIDELTTMLASEAAGEVGEKSKDIAGDLDARIAAGLDRVKKHLDS